MRRIVPGRGAELVLALWGVLALGGCIDDGSAVEVTEWVLEAEGHRHEVTLPVHLDAFVPGERSRYELSTTVSVPPRWRGELVTLSIPNVAAGVTLRANGVRMERVPGDPLAGIRSRGSYVFRIPASHTDADTLDLELSVLHSWTRSAWWDTVPRLSSAPDGDAQTRFVQAFNFTTNSVGLGVYATITFTYLVLFLFDRRRIAYGYLGTATLTASYYLLFVLGLTEPMAGPVEIGLLGATLALSVFAGIFATQTRFLGTSPSRRTWLLLALLVAICLSTAGRFQEVYYPTLLVSLTLVAGIGYIVVRLLRVAVRERNGTAAFEVFCWTPVGVVAIVDGTVWCGGGELLGGLRFGAIGLGMYALLQFIFLCRTHLVALDEGERLNEALSRGVDELKEKNAEVERLNIELRRQIAERSQRLADALARLESLPSDVALAPGDRIEERYRVIRQVGAGGSGVVHEVERLTDGKRLAMKVLRNRADISAMARFAREANLLSTIDHENVVAITDTGVSATGLMYQVTEFVEGYSLDRWRTHYGDSKWGLPVLAQVARGLAAIHDRGVVHRDLKPGNVLLTDAAVVKITDFGISAVSAPPSTAELWGDGTEDEAPAETLEAPRTAATEVQVPVPRAVSTESSSKGTPEGPSVTLTRTAMLLGTPRYMAPELAHGMRESTAASDVFAFGVLAYEVLMGKRPFDMPPYVAVKAGRWEAEFPPFDGTLPAALESLVSQCLAAEPEARPSVQQVVAALEQALAALGDPTTGAREGERQAGSS